MPLHLAAVRGEQEIFPFVNSPSESDQGAEQAAYRTRALRRFVLSEHLEVR